MLISARHYRNSKRQAEAYRTFGTLALMETQSLIITRVRDQARITRSFDLRPAGTESHHGINFIPGQVAILKVAEEAPAYFAFAGAPEDSELEVLVKQKVGASNVIYDMTCRRSD